MSRTRPCDQEDIVCTLPLLIINLSTMSKKMQDDGKMATTTLTPAAHFFPDILSKQTEASGSIVTSQTQLVGNHMQLYNHRIAVPI